MLHLRQIHLSRAGLLLAVCLLLCGSFAGFTLGQVLAHNSSAAALPLEDQRASIAATTSAPSSASSRGSTSGGATGTTPGVSGTSGGSGGNGSQGGSGGATGSGANGGRSASGSQPGATSAPKNATASGSTARVGASGTSESSQAKHHSKGNARGHSHGHHGDASQDNGSDVSVAQTGNGQTIIVSGNGSSVTIDSNGSGTSVSVVSSGNPQGQSGSGNANVSCSAAQLRGSWPAITEPLRQDEALIVRQGSTLPVRFQLQGGCAGNGLVQARLYLAPMNGDFIPALSAGVGNQGNVFRFDTHSGQYVYTLTTRGLPPGMYHLGIDLGNGQLFVVPFALR